MLEDDGFLQNFRPTLVFNDVGLGDQTTYKKYNKNFDVSSEGPSFGIDEEPLLETAKFLLNFSDTEAYHRLINTDMYVYTDI
jgi:hypothetical protein